MFICQTLLYKAMYELLLIQLTLFLQYWNQKFNLFSFLRLSVVWQYDKASGLPQIIVARAVLSLAPVQASGQVVW